MENNRVRYVGSPKNWPLDFPGNTNHPHSKMGTLTAEIADRCIRNSGETSDECQSLDDEYSRNHVMIRWDDCVHAWSCHVNDFELIS